MTTKRSVTHATIHLERTYDAVPSRVFEAFADPAASDRWFVSAEGWELAEYQHDFREGGRETGRFSPKKGDPVIYNNTHYQQIVPNHRIIYAYTMAQEETLISVSLLTLEFKSEGGKTRLVLTEQGAFLDGADQPANREAGWAELLDNLGKEIRGELVGPA